MRAFRPGEHRFGGTTFPMFVDRDFTNTGNAVDTQTAQRVGSRHGEAVILRVAALTMHAAGRAFYRSANGVWLTDNVPPAFLSR
jgi:hypothetical protein